MQSIRCMHCTHSYKKKRNTPRKPQKVKHASKRLVHRELGQKLSRWIQRNSKRLKSGFCRNRANQNAK